MARFTLPTADSYPSYPPPAPGSRKPFPGLMGTRHAKVHIHTHRQDTHSHTNLKHPVLHIQRQFLQILLPAAFRPWQRELAFRPQGLLPFQAVLMSSSLRVSLWAVVLCKFTCPLYLGCMPLSFCFSPLPRFGNGE